MYDILVKAGCYIAIILLGYVLRRRGFFGDNAFPVLSNIVIKITLPAAIVASTSGKEVNAAMLALTALGFGGGVVYILLAALLHKNRDPAQKAFAILNTPGYNIGAFAMPFTQGFLGPMGVLATSLSIWAIPSSAWEVPTAWPPPSRPARASMSGGSSGPSAVRSRSWFI